MINLHVCDIFSLYQTFFFRFTNFTESFFFYPLPNFLQEAYKDWLCSTKLPYYNDQGELVKPCLSQCRWAHRMCPYLLPHRQYCGQRAFLCPGKLPPTWSSVIYPIHGAICLGRRVNWHMQEKCLI